MTSYIRAIRVVRVIHRHLAGERLLSSEYEVVRHQGRRVFDSAGHLSSITLAGRPDLAVLIAVNRRPGDDVAIALDYRSSAEDPAVVASDACTHPKAYR